MPRSRPAPAQKEQRKPAIDPALFAALKYRPIGPFRGGRSAACCGVPGKPAQFYFGATGGGVWKTTDAGATWDCVSDGFFGGSIGAVEVCAADRNVVYVGGGEVTVRGNVSHGSGMWKSTDAGKTWKSIGLGDAHHIPRIRSHPKNADLVYVAALGHLYGPNKERGVFRSKDGGKTWDKVLFVNAEVGAVDLILDPGNPRILYASTWRVEAHALQPGERRARLGTVEEHRRRRHVERDHAQARPAQGDGRHHRRRRLARGQRPRLGDCRGRGRRRLPLRRRRREMAAHQRGHQPPPARLVLHAHLRRPQEPRRGLRRQRAILALRRRRQDLRAIRAPHGDYHDLWIDPDDPDRLIVANDGGAQVSFNHGKTWSTYHNQPTAQFYRVTTDNHFPYRIYGAQQDNTTVRILSRSDGFTIDEHDWEPTAGFESGWVAPNLDDPEIVFGGNYSGFIGRRNHRTQENRVVSVWPDEPIGHGAAKLKYRFQWNFPIFFSPHDSRTLYAAGNVLFKTTSEGQSWQPISPDLTRNDKSKLGPSGGPITKDNTSVEYYCTIFAACESPLAKGVLWCGSDDGLIHVSKDGGKSWTKVTPPDLPEWAQINSIEPHPFEKGGLYVAATRYKLDDFRPYLYRTTDYGKTWKKIVAGIPAQHFTRVIRADPVHRGILYAGTEQGMYVSFNDGESWQAFQLNLPTVPITDLAIKNNDLIVATQGRSFWVLDDVTVLHQLRPELAGKPLTALHPRPAYRLAAGSTDTPPKTAGQNPPTGAVAYYYLHKAPTKDAPLSVEILDKDRKVVRRFPDKKAAKQPGKAPSKKGKGGGAVRRAESDRGPESLRVGPALSAAGRLPGHGALGRPDGAAGRARQILRALPRRRRRADGRIRRAARPAHDCDGQGHAGAVRFRRRRRRQADRGAPRDQEAARRS